MKFMAGNIWSGSKTLAVLTNPTCLAKRKGNLQGDYPIQTDDGKVYPDIEAAYHELGDRGNHKHDMGYMAGIMTCLMILKFKQYPRILQAVKDSGGEDFLCKCSHTVNGGRWEGVGVRSEFIKCLVYAYRYMAD